MVKGDRPFSHSAVKYYTMLVHLNAFIASVQQNSDYPKGSIQLPLLNRKTIGHSVDKRVARSCTNHSQAKSRLCRSSPQPKFVLAWDRLAFRSLQWWLLQVYHLQNRPDWKVLPWRNDLTRRVQDYWSLFKECFRLWLPQDHISDLVRFSILHLVLPSGSFPNHVLIDVQNVRLTVWVFTIGL